MDPEDLRDVISAYQRCVAETVRRFGVATIRATAGGGGAMGVSASHNG
jgi:class 3 adenylate cyclase